MSILEEANIGEWAAWGRVWHGLAPARHGTLADVHLHVGRCTQAAAPASCTQPCGTRPVAANWHTHPRPPRRPCRSCAVCTTLSFSGSSAFTRLARKFDVVVIDEAAQVERLLRCVLCCAVLCCAVSCCVLLCVACPSMFPHSTGRGRQHGKNTSTTTSIAGPMLKASPPPRPHFHPSHLSSHPRNHSPAGGGALHAGASGPRRRQASVPSGRPRAAARHSHVPGRAGICMMWSSCGVWRWVCPAA